MNWKLLWMRLFGTTTLFHLDMGFWVSLGVVIWIVLLMNFLFLRKKTSTKQATDRRSKKSFPRSF